MHLMNMLIKFTIFIFICLHILTTTHAAENDKHCLAPGESCYQKNTLCCTGYKCASGPVATLPRPTDRCISDKIIG